MPAACSFYFQHTAPSEIYTLSLHDALPIWLSLLSSRGAARRRLTSMDVADVVGTNAGFGEGYNPVLRNIHRRSEEHTSELQSRLHLVCRLLLEKKKESQHTNSSCSTRHTK